MTPLLETRGLSIRFGGLVAVSDLNLRIAAGELVGRTRSTRGDWPGPSRTSGSAAS